MRRSEATRRRDAQEWGWAPFVALLLLQMWAAHALVFFAHVSAAWLLGWRSNPVALDYAHPTHEAARDGSLASHPQRLTLRV